MTVFRPGVSVTLDTSTAPNSVALPAASLTVRLLNNSATKVWVKFGGPPVVAAIPASGTPDSGIMIGAGATEAFSRPNGATWLAAILPAGATASTLDICCGEGE